MQGLLEANKEYSNSSSGTFSGKIAGTSNVHLAQKYDVAPIGTIAHEWIMAIGALEMAKGNKTSYLGLNGIAMDLWDKTYPSGALSIMLTDTFGSKIFLEDFVSNPVRANHWKGLRQDSGDPISFLNNAKAAYEKIGIDPKSSRFFFFIRFEKTFPSVCFF